MRALPLVFLLFVGCPKTPAPPSPGAPTSPPSAPTTTPAPDYAAHVAAPDRTDADRALDAGRHPAQLLAFFEIRPGMNVAEIGAAGGYTTELLARTVATGRVYGQNSQDILDRFAAAPWAERLARPVNANVLPLVAPFDAPFPDSVRDLDVVVNVLFYHDTAWMGTDRARMNAAIFRALKPGGIYGIVDHSAAVGHGVADVQTLHRIEQDVVVREIAAAGFVLEAEADFLRNPSDTRDWNGNPRSAGEQRGMTDRFVLRFRKPG